MPPTFSNPSYVPPPSDGSGVTYALLEVPDASARLALPQQSALGRAVKQVDDGTIWSLIPGGFAEVPTNWQRVSAPAMADLASNTPPSTPEQRVLAREALGAADRVEAARSTLAIKHPNALLKFSLLREQLRLNKSVDIVAVGDSTGDGTSRWPRQLALKLAAAYPHYNVQFNRVTQDATKAWVPEAIQTAPGASDPRQYWPPASGIAAWSAGTYAAGSYVTHAGNTWFSLVDGNTETPELLTTTKWRKATPTAQVLLSGEEVPYLHGDGTATSTKSFEIELEYTMMYLATNQMIFGKSALAPSDNTKGFVRFYQHQKLFQFHWAGAVGGTLAYSGYTNAQLPVADGVRTRVRLTFTPTNASNRVIVLAYSTFNGSTWSAYTEVGWATTTQPTTQWVVPPGPLAVNMVENSTLYRVTIRRSTNGIVECNHDIDQYDGFGIKAPLHLGTPTITIWNYAWSGLELQAFTGVYPLTGATYVDYNTDFTPRNTCAFIVNTGHNANSISSGKWESNEYAKLYAMAAARFPRASYFVTAQNPGIDARGNGTPGQYLDYTFLEPMKISRQAHLLDTAIKNGWGFLDIRRAFRETADPESLVTDGLHPNADGSLLWADELFHLIQG